MTVSPGVLNILGRALAATCSYPPTIRNSSRRLSRMAERLLKGPFTVDDYHRLAKLGILDEDDRVELLDGQVVEMTPIGPEHAGCVDALTTLLSRRGGGAAALRGEQTLN